MNHIVCFGDSNVYGYDPRSYLGGRYPKEVRWTGLLESAGWVVKNEGFNGQEIPSSAWEQEHWCQRLRMAAPDQVLVMLGGNDLLVHPHFTAEDVAHRMEEMLSKLLSVWEQDRAGVLLVSPPPMVPGSWITEKRLIRESGRFAGQYRRVADTLGIRFADAGAWDVALAYDGVHFLPEGHRAFARGLIRVLNEKAF